MPEPKDGAGWLEAPIEQSTPGSPFRTLRNNRESVEVGDTDPRKRTGDYVWNFEAFVVYRPHEVCSRCRDAVKAGTVTLPDVGDYTCPHTDVAKYRAIMLECAEGRCKMFGRKMNTNELGIVTFQYEVARPKNGKPIRPTPSGGNGRL